MHLYSKPDLHMHSVFSDGTDSPEELVKLVQNQGVDLFSITDHDGIDATRLVMNMERHPDFISGVEFSCKENGKKYHILGYGYNPDADAITEVVKRNYESRIDKAYRIIEILKKDYGFIFGDDEIADILSQRSPGKPHFANLMVKRSYVSDSVSAFEILNTIKTGALYLTPSEAIDVIISSGGIPVLAHGVLEDGRGNLDFDEMHQRVKALKADGLMGLECYYSTFESGQHEIMISIAEKEKLLVTAGSDYHGKNKSVKLGDAGVINPSFEMLEPFYYAVSARIISC